MARINCYLVTMTVLAALCLVGPPCHGQDRLHPEDIPSPEAARAFKQYWKAFETYERKVTQDAERKHAQSVTAMHQRFKSKSNRLTAEQIRILEQAATKYRGHLQSHIDASNRPFVMLNYAQILNLIGDHKVELGNNEGSFSKSEAIALLQEVEKSYPDFIHIEESYYLHAIILESLDRPDEARSIWLDLTKRSGQTIYGVHARLALGDYFFNKDESQKALRYYRSALVAMANVTVKNKEFEELRLHYRVAWAAYRSAEINQVVTSGKRLLQPGVNLGSAAEYSNITDDAVELIGNALFENNDFKFTMATLNDRSLNRYGAAIAYQTLRRYSANEIQSEIIKIGPKVLRQFPLAMELPEIVQVVAKAYEVQRRTHDKIATMQLLANVLPKNSLWRAHNQRNFEAVSNMEVKAKTANILVASHFYERGLNTGNTHHFASASSHYQNLLNHSANDPSANNWRLRRAHCAYFSGDLAGADQGYSELIEAYKSDENVIQVAAYQLVLTREKAWRESFAKVVNGNDEPKKDPITVASVAKLEEAIDSYSARYPNQSRAVDLLLVGASSNRDMERLDRAAKYWQKVLVSKPSAAQRTIAIRGLVFARMKNGSTDEVLNLASQFLKLEDWRKLGLNLDTELKGVVSAAALEEGDRLYENGEAREAGALLVKIAREFSDLPNRPRIFRNGAYMLAASGDWQAAQAAADDFLATKFKDYRSDMMYLKGLAAEFQFRLSDAVTTYLALGRTYPKHTRARKSLTKAIRYAKAEGNYDQASEAAAVMAAQATSTNDRMKHYKDAIELLEQGDNHEAAAKMAFTRLKAARSAADKLESELMMARNRYQVSAAGEKEALEQLQGVVRKLRASRRSIPQEPYNRIAAEAYFLLGEESRNRFDDFDIFERAGGIQANLKRKTEYFEDLVSNYSASVELGNPKFSAAAAYRLAEAADHFASDVGSIPKRATQPISAASQQRYDSTVNRLKGISRKFLTTNLIAARRDPARYKGNVWVKRSALKLPGNMTAKADENSVAKDYQLPVSAKAIMPANWSL